MPVQWRDSPARLERSPAPAPFHRRPQPNAPVVVPRWPRRIVPAGREPPRVQSAVRVLRLETRWRTRTVRRPRRTARLAADNPPPGSARYGLRGSSSRVRLASRRASSGRPNAQCSAAMALKLWGSNSPTGDCMNRSRARSAPSQSQSNRNARGVLDDAAISRRSGSRRNAWLMYRLTCGQASVGRIEAIGHHHGVVAAQRRIGQREASDRARSPSREALASRVVLLGGPSLVMAGLQVEIVGIGVGRGMTHESCSLRARRAALASHRP